MKLIDFSAPSDLIAKLISPRFSGFFLSAVDRKGNLVSRYDLEGENQTSHFVPKEFVSPKFVSYRLLIAIHSPVVLPHAASRCRYSLSVQ